MKRGEQRGDVRLLVKGRCTRAEKRIVWNQRGPSGPTGPSGPAGPPGSASGSEPPNDSVNSAKVLDGSLTAADLGADSVRASELAGASRREGTGTVAGGPAGNGVWNHGSATASCLAGEQLVAGSAAWHNESSGDPMAILEIIPDFAANSVTVKGATDVAADRTLRAIAICFS